MNKKYGDDTEKIVLDRLILDFKVNSNKLFENGKREEVSDHIYTEVDKQKDLFLKTNESIQEKRSKLKILDEDIGYQNK